MFCEEGPKPKRHRPGACNFRCGSHLRDPSPPGRGHPTSDFAAGRVLTRWDLGMMVGMGLAPPSDPEGARPSEPEDEYPEALRTVMAEVRRRRRSLTLPEAVDVV